MQRDKRTFQMNSEIIIQALILTAHDHRRFVSAVLAASRLPQEVGARLCTRSELEADEAAGGRGESWGGGGMGAYQLQLGESRAGQRSKWV